MNVAAVATKDTNPKDMVAAGKIPLALCSPIAKAHWSLAQHAGMCKYGAWNWRITGVRASVYLHAMGRHMDAYLSGEDSDPVDGTHHLGNIMACAAILMDAEEAGKLTDDRPPMVGIRAAYAKLEALATRLAVQYKDKTPKHYTIVDEVVPLPPRVPSGLGVLARNLLDPLPARTVIHTENPDPPATSSTIPSGPLGPRFMTSIPVSSTDPDADPPPSYSVEPDPFPARRMYEARRSEAPSTLRSSQDAPPGTVYVTKDHRLEQEEIKDYHVLHMRSCKLLEHVYMDNAVDAWDAMTAYMAFAAVGDVVTVIKLGNLIYSKVKDKV